MDTVELLIALGKIGFIFTVLILGAAMSVLAERRVSAFIQNRVGPNRVGPGGIIQPFADVLKLVMKEDITPRNANRFIHDLAPIISITVALSTFAVVPFGNTVELFGRTIKLMLADVNIGILFVLAFTWSESTGSASRAGHRTTNTRSSAASALRRR